MFVFQPVAEDAMVLTVSSAVTVKTVPRVMLSLAPACAKRAGLVLAALRTKVCQERGTHTGNTCSPRDCVT